MATTYSFLRTKLFIENEYVPATTPSTLSVHNPSTEALITADVPIAGAADVDRAVSGALRAFRDDSDDSDAGGWASRTGAQRAALLHRFADLLDANADGLGALEGASMGMPPASAAYSVRVAADSVRYFAGWADKIAGRTFRAEGGGPFKVVTYAPLGVVAGVGPWNASYTTFAWTMAPALAAGNTFVYKGSERSPLGILALGELIKQAGFPPGVVQLLSGPGSTGALLAEHMQVSKISFTGSVATGKKIQQMAIGSNMKRCVLELGGKSPAIVFDDADVENAVKYCVMGLLTNSGQMCIASSRILVQESIAEPFTRALAAAFRDAAQPTQPLVDGEQFARVLAYIEAGKREAKLAAGGARIGSKGYYVEPTLFTDVATADASIVREEIFGPVGVVRTFRTEGEAVEVANDTLYGLSSSLFTKSMGRALRVASKLEAGTVGVNINFLPSVQAPFGGWKQSGSGRELGHDGVMAYVEARTIHINMDI